MKHYVGAFFLMYLGIQPAPAVAQEDAEPQDPFWQNAYCINPRAPMSVRRSPTDGEVSLIFDITAEGKPENIRVTAQQADADETGRLAAAFARSAQNALQRWEYYAYMKGDIESAREDVPITFQFQRSVTDARNLPREQACLTGLVPAGPTHAGDPTDPLNNLKRCWRVRMPRPADREGRSARINVTFDVAENGDVENIRLADSQEENNFTKQVLTSLRKWKYHTFLKDGEPIARNNLTLDFIFGDFSIPDNNKRCHHAPFGSSHTGDDVRKKEKCEITFEIEGVPRLSAGCYKFPDER